MKKILFLLLLFCASFFITKAQSLPAEHLANRIADKMRDSLTLSSQQRQQIYAINIRLSNQKMQARSRSQNRDSVGSALQQIENSRNSLYRAILTQQQFDRYRQKKRKLVSAN